MNITVRPYGSRHFCCRPDTTWEREDKDLYAPESVNGYLWTPVLFARVCKAGKCIGKKFASRYYDAIGYGILLYVSDLLDGSREGYACASCADHTSVLPFPMYDKVTIENGDNVFSVSKDGEEIYATSEGSTEMIEEALSDASRLVSMRIGDIVAIELAPAAPLAVKDCTASETVVGIGGAFCGNSLFKFNIIM